MHRRLTVAVLTGLVAVSLAAAPAVADGTGDAYNDGDEIGAGARDPGTGGGTGGRSGGGTSPCRYEPLDDAAQESARSLADGGWGQEAGQGPGAFYRRVCVTEDGQSTATIVWLAEPPPAVDPEQLAREALDRTPIPTPAIRFNPPEGQEQVVNVPTWLWLDAAGWTPVSATASAGSVTVVTTATPAAVRWEMGNGDVVTCAGRGTAYDPAIPAREQHSDCTYTYPRSSAGRPGGAFTVSVTTSWNVTWTVTGAPGGGSLGTASRTATTTVRVAEIQALNE